MPIQTNATLNPILTKIANLFLRDPKGFVGSRLAPPFPTALQAASYYVFGQDELANVPLLKARAPGSGYPRVTSVLSNDNYYCQNYGLEGLVPDEERAKYGAFFDADLAKVRKIVDTLKVNAEMRVHTLATNTANVPYAGVAVKWDDPSSNPKDDVDAAKEYIRQQTGMEVNLMVISNPVFLKLQQHPRLLDVFKFTTPGLLNEDKLASYFGLPQGGIAIAKTVQATNLEGQVFTPADIWGHDCILAHVESGDDLELPNFARTFYWTAFTSPVTPATGGTGPGMMAGGGGGPDLIQIMDYRDETKKSDVHRGEHYVGEKVVGKNAAFYLQNVLSFLVMIIALLALSLAPAARADTPLTYPTGAPNFMTPDTNTASFAVTNGQTLSYTAGSTNTLAKAIRQNVGLSLFLTVICPTVIPTSTSTNYTVKFDVTGDGTTWTGGGGAYPFVWTVPLAGLTGPCTNTYWTNIPASTASNFRKIQATQVSTSSSTNWNGKLSYSQTGQ